MSQKCLIDAIEASGLTLFACIDHAANARAVGMSMPPATSLLYGNGRGGTPIMLEAPQAALELPLRALVQERDGRTVVMFHLIAPLLEQVGVPRDLAGRLEPAQRLLVWALAR